MVDLFVDTSILLFLGLCGWTIFALLKLPIAPLFGSIVIIGALRLAHLPLPATPFFFSPLIMLFLGYYVGSQVTKETAYEMKLMIVPVIIIIVWTLTVAFLVGSLLSIVTNLDSYTAILSSCIGGLAEVTIIAVDTGADVAIVTFIHSFRSLTTVVLFPLIYQKWIDKPLISKKAAINSTKVKTNFQIEKKNAKIVEESPDKINLFYVIRNFSAIKKQISNAGWRHYNLNTDSLLVRAIISIIIASSGAYLFWYWRVPAGAMVGSMLFVTTASLAGFRVISFSPKVFGFLLIGVGIIVGGNITKDTIVAVTSANILMVATLLTALMMASSLLVAFIISKVSGWDFATSFLAASPAGLSVMTPLAIKFNRNPFRVSMLHLCRLLAINAIVPFVFMILNK